MDQGKAKRTDSRKPGDESPSSTAHHPSRPCTHAPPLLRCHTPTSPYPRPGKRDTNANTTRYGLVASLKSYWLRLLRVHLMTLPGALTVSVDTSAPAAFRASKNDRFSAVELNR